MVSDEAVLIWDDVSVRYPRNPVQVVTSCSFRIGSSERVALFGLNGSGKTTVLLASVGLLPSEGSITVAGLTLAPSKIEEIRRRIGFVFSVPDDQILFPEVLDDVAFTLRSRGIEKPEAEERAIRVLSELGCADLAHRSAYELSHGQRIRVALAGALVSAPPLLLLDEPSAGLDPPGKRLLASYLRNHPAGMLLATHDIDFARQVCERFLLLHEGRIAAEGDDMDQIERYWCT